ncbi:MAG: hypothetical protein IPI64_06310 [Chloracidobacterium sp.]|nr:hypothetical protein [Chloracidobacterium sp.]
MFEQSIYDTEPVAAPTSEGDLFHTYEIKTWEFGPRIYKILAIAAVGNLFALLVFAQTSLLTMKGCDSPLVGRVCEALDVVYVGTMLFGTDRDYVDQVYEKTDLGDADITFVDVSGTAPPLSYPEGYFQIANPEEFAMIQQQANDPMFNNSGFPPGIPYTPPTTSGNSLLDTKPNIPKTNNDVIDGELPTLGGGGTTGSTDKPRKPRQPKATPTPDDSTTAGNNPKVDPLDPATTYDINKRPFVDLANNVNDLLDKKQVRLDSAFIVNATGKLTKEGRLDPKSFKWGQITSEDQKMVDVVKTAIAAINDSGYLQYLKDVSGKDFNLMLQQDETNISAIVQSEMESETRARSISSGLAFLISAAKSRKSGEGADQNDKDDLVLLENAKVEAIGKKIVIKFLVPKDIALPMIQRKLAEQKAAPKQQNGNAVGGLSSNTAALK